MISVVSRLRRLNGSRVSRAGKQSGKESGSGDTVEVVIVIFRLLGVGWKFVDKDD